MSSIADNLQGVKRRITAAIAARDQAHSTIKSAPIRLIAVSKTKPANAIRTAFEAGQHDFGENYVQEAVAKIIELSDLRDLKKTENESITWHLIGPLQSNKAKLAAHYFDWVQSVDREKIAATLNANRDVAQARLNVLIQVNISGEESKGGITLDETPRLAEFIASQPRLTLRGLMSIVENTTNEQALREQFQLMAKCYLMLQTRFDTIDTLSLGMSEDFPLAIMEGSTMIRVGRAIFGERQP
jgi:PLP dependent protein